MAELLIVASTLPVHPDPDVEFQRTAKGDIMSVQDDGFLWGTKEQPPLFIRVNVPGVTKAQIQHYVNPWSRQLSFFQVSRDTTQDGWRFRIESATRRLSDNAGILKNSDIAQTLLEWGANYVRMDPEGPVLDWWVVAGALSEAFWGGDPTTFGVAVSEIGYDLQSGIHTLTADYSSGKAALASIDSATFLSAYLAAGDQSAFILSRPLVERLVLRTSDLDAIDTGISLGSDGSAEAAAVVATFPNRLGLRVLKRIQSFGGQDQTIGTDFITYTLDRQDVVDRFKADVLERPSSSTVKRHQYSIPASAVDAELARWNLELISDPGATYTGITRTPAQVTAILIDHQAL